MGGDLGHGVFGGAMGTGVKIRSTLFFVVRAECRGENDGCMTVIVRGLLVTVALGLG